MKRRMINPDFFTDSLIVGTLDYPGRIFYVGLWVVAEDSGVFEPDLLGLKMKIFPGDALDPETIAAYYDTLKGAGKVVEYEAGGRRYAWLRNFFKHQHLDRPNPPTLPLPPCVTWLGKEELNDDNRRHWHYQITEHCRHDDGTMTAIGCPCDALKERKGKERKVTEEERNGKEVKGKRTRVREAEQQQPVPPVEGAARLASFPAPGSDRESLIRSLAAGEISDDQFKEQIAALGAAV